MLSLREKAFRNLVFASALVLFLILGVCYTYTIGKIVLCLVGVFLLIVAIFLLTVTFNTWRRVREE
jgi:CHASE2 domain-containing sensor protein